MSRNEEDAEAQENVVKAYAIDWNENMMSPIKCCIRYQYLSFTGQKVICILSSITSLQKVKDPTHRDDDDDVKNVMILFQNRNENNLSFNVRGASQAKFLYEDDRDAHNCSIECNILHEATEGGDGQIVMNMMPYIAKVECRGFSFSVVNEDHEGVKDVDKMLRMKANVSTRNSSLSGSCYYSSKRLAKSDAAKGMESFADVQILQTFSSLVPQCGYPGYTSQDTQGNVSQVIRLEWIIYSSNLCCLGMVYI